MAKLAEDVVLIDSEEMQRKSRKSKFVIEREQAQAKLKKEKEKSKRFLIACGILDENGEVTDIYKGVFTKGNDD